MVLPRPRKTIMHLNNVVYILRPTSFPALAKAKPKTKVDERSSLLGTSWGRLGPSRGRLGAVLGRLGHPGAVLGPSWALLGPSWAVLGPSWGHLDSSWAVSVTSQAVLGPSWAQRRSPTANPLVQLVDATSTTQKGSTLLEPPLSCTKKTVPESTYPRRRSIAFAY